MTVSRTASGTPERSLIIRNGPPPGQVELEKSKRPAPRPPDPVVRRSPAPSTWSGTKIAVAIIVTLAAAGAVVSRRVVRRYRSRRRQEESGHKPAEPAEWDESRPTEDALDVGGENEAEHARDPVADVTVAASDAQPMAGATAGADDSEPTALSAGADGSRFRGLLLGSDTEPSPRRTHRGPATKAVLYDGRSSPRIAFTTAVRLQFSDHVLAAVTTHFSETGIRCVVPPETSAAIPGIGTQLQITMIVNDDLMSIQGRLEEARQDQTGHLLEIAFATLNPRDQELIATLLVQEQFQRPSGSGDWGAA